MVDLPNKNRYDSSRGPESSRAIVAMDTQNGFGGELAEFRDEQILAAPATGMALGGVSVAMFLRNRQPTKEGELLNVVAMAPPRKFDLLPTNEHRVNVGREPFSMKMAPPRPPA